MDRVLKHSLDFNPWRKLQSLNPGYRNLGDELNQFLLKSLTTEDKVSRFNERQANFFGIGSILEIAATSGKMQKVIWGSGLRNSRPVNELGSNFRVLGLRGKLTAESLGFKNETAFGDPALLVSRFYKSNKPRNPDGIVLAPHFSFFGMKGSQEAINQANKIGLKILYPNTDTDAALELIRNCELLISSALHPLVIADAFCVPAFRIAKYAPTENQFKYQDYLSIASPNMSWHELNDLSDIDCEAKIIKNLEISSRRLEVLRVNVPKIQDNLIESFNEVKGVYSSFSN